ncbi:MAG: hypothetical protein LBG96_17630, partial [Tannerella sp.]|nr:hypothetical protein [Tannerella sp.]
MKKIVLSFMLSSLICLYLYPQTLCDSNEPAYFVGQNVYTCNGISIITLEPNCEFSVQEKATIKSSVLAEYASKGITNNDILDDASTQYNCHAYAWHLTEGNTNKVWINQTMFGGANLSKYWDESNGCFVPTTIEANAEKIFYYSGDHSAVKSNISGKYESKWGVLPLIRHSPTSVPSSYQPSNRIYYKRRYIIGPTMVCTSGATFTAINVSSGYTWSHSSNLNAPS